MSGVQFVILVLIFVPRPIHAAQVKRLHFSFSHITKPFRDRMFRRMWFVGLCTAIVLSQQLTTFAIYLTNQGGSTPLYGGLIAFGSILIIVLEFPLTTVFNHVSANRVMSFGCIALAGAAGLCAIINSPWWLILSVCAFSLGTMIYSPSYDSIGAEIALTDQRGAYMGLLWLATGLGFAIGPALGGQLLYISPLLCWIVICCISLLASALAWTTPTKRK